MLPFKSSPTLLTCEALGVNTALRREHLFVEAKGSGDNEVDLEVWKQTREERGSWLDQRFYSFS